MKQYQRILVCIDRPRRDHQMLGYAGAISRAAETKEVHLLHVETDEGKPPGEVVPEVPTEECTVETLRALATEHLAGHGSEDVICRIVTGSPLLEILRYALEKDVDLIIVGRWPGGGHERGDHAILAGRIARKATCSVLVFPENASVKADKILVPARNSECSSNALEVACSIAAVKGATVCCLNVFPVHSGYLNVGITLEEHTERMRDFAEHECEELLTRTDTGGANVTTRCVADLYTQPVPIILDEIKEESADLVVIGARGRTGAAGVLLGAVTERLIHESTVPLLAVKKKGECIGVLRALLSLVE